MPLKPQAKAKRKAKAKPKRQPRQIQIQIVEAGAPDVEQTAPAAAQDHAPLQSDIIDNKPTAKEDVQEVGRQKKLQEMFSAMQAAAIALSSERNSLCMDVIHFMVAPIRQFYTYIQECIRGGPASIRNFYAKLALGEMHEASIQIWMSLQSPEVLIGCGVILERSSQTEDDILDGDPLIMEQCSIAELLDNCALSLIAERVDESCTHEYDFISKCAGLLHPEETKQRQTLEHLKRIAHAFHKAVGFHGSATLQRIISRSSFNGSLEKAPL